ncbi:MAG: hypothetical protein ABIP51_15080 [Bacteroidia bacterium]
MICENCKEKEAIVLGKYSKKRFCSRLCSHKFCTKNDNKKETKKTNCVECDQEIKINKRTCARKAKCSDCKNKNRKRVNYIPRIKRCKFCAELLETKTKKHICEKCRRNYYDYYRFSAEFNFEFKKYKNFFSEEENDLIKKNGWYSPSNKRNNLKGVSKDHMFSVRDGFINKIDIQIIKHPANCKILIHSDNQKKKSNSSISLLNLLKRIKEFEEKSYSNEIIIKEVENMTRCLSGLKG